MLSKRNAQRNALNVSFTTQVKINHKLNPIEKKPTELARDVNDVKKNVSAPFKSHFEASDMRQLALVAHNHMKPAM